MTPSTAETITGEKVGAVNAGAVKIIAGGETYLDLVRIQASGLQQVYSRLERLIEIGLHRKLTKPKG